MVELDNDNLAYVQLIPNGVRGTYVWWELQHDEVTVPITAGSFDYYGLHNARPYFVRGAATFFLWYDTPSRRYRVTTNLGLNDGPGDPWWEAETDDTPIGLFEAEGTAMNDLTFDMPADPDCEIVPVTPGP